MKRNDAIIVSFVYPGWHQSSYRPATDEWRLLVAPSRYFSQQNGPARPIEGFYDDSDMSVVKAQIHLAATHQIHGFSYFVYHSSHGSVCSAPFENALAVASEAPNFRVSATWCARLPIRHFPIRLDEVFDVSRGANIYIKQQRYRMTPLSNVEALHLFDHWAEHTFRMTSYWSLTGRPVLLLLSLPAFESSYGMVGLSTLVKHLRQRVAGRMGVEPYVIGVISRLDRRNIGLANYLPLDAVTGYGLLPDWDGPVLQDYNLLVPKRIRDWYTIQQAISVPFLPVIVAGWDATVRGERIHQVKREYLFPWSPIVTGNTPETFGRFLDAALQFNMAAHPATNIVFVHAWNEWTEGCAIEPSDIHGAEFINQINCRLS